jgi:hypothetical protein
MYRSEEPVVVVSSAAAELSCLINIESVNPNTVSKPYAQNQFLHLFMNYPAISCYNL